MSPDGRDLASLKDAALRYAFARGYRVDDDGVLWGSLGRRLNPRSYDNRYPIFTVWFRSRRVALQVHRLVAFQKFGESYLAGHLEARHRDNNKSNSRPDNIILGTHVENSLDLPPDRRREIALKGQATRRARAA